MNTTKNNYCVRYDNPKDLIPAYLRHFDLLRFLVLASTLPPNVACPRLIGICPFFSMIFKLIYLPDKKIKTIFSIHFYKYYQPELSILFLQILKWKLGASTYGNSLQIRMNLLSNR
jgi:hypothetical protein